MATTKPRINITIEPHQYAILKRFAELTDVSMSEVIRELMAPAFEPLERLSVMMEGVKNSSKQVHDGIKESFKKVANDMEPVLAENLSQFDMFLGRINEITKQDFPRTVTTGDSTPPTPLKNQGLRG